MKCSTCGSDNTTDANFCEECGASLRPTLGADEHLCPSCEEIIKKAAELCPKCGVRLRDTSGRKSAKPSSKWLRAIPIVSLILGILGTLMLLADIDSGVEYWLST